MRRKSNRYYLQLLLGLLLIGIIPASHGAEETPGTTWIGKDGKAIEASVIGFNAIEKKVIWKMPGGAEAQSPISSLSQESRAALLVEPPISEYIGQNSSNYDFTKIPRERWLIAVTLLAIVLLVVYLADFLCFKLAVRILVDPDRDFIAYLKQIGAGLVLSIPTNVINFVAGGKWNLFAIIVTFIFGVLQIVVFFWILKAHYQISVSRAIGLGVLRGFFFVIGYAIAVFLLILLAGVFAPSTSSLWGPLIDDFIFRPLGMLQ